MSLTCEMTSAVGVTSLTWIAESTHLPLLYGSDDSRYLILVGDGLRWELKNRPPILTQLLLGSEGR